jgi:hypothetical protein
VVFVHNGDADPSHYTVVNIQNVRILLRPTTPSVTVAEALASLTS